jgi:hypothetical protein
MNRSRYEKEYYDVLQELQDREAEMNQRDKRKAKEAQKKLRKLAKELAIWSHLASHVPPKVFEAIWKGQKREHPEWEGITKFLFPNSK